MKSISFIVAINTSLMNNLLSKEFWFCGRDKHMLDFVENLRKSAFLLHCLKLITLSHTVLA